MAELWNIGRHNLLELIHPTMVKPGEIVWSGLLEMIHPMGNHLEVIYSLNRNVIGSLRKGHCAEPLSIGNVVKVLLLKLLM